jgi:hypothetical protein
MRSRLQSLLADTADPSGAAVALETAPLPLHWHLNSTGVLRGRQASGRGSEMSLPPMWPVVRNNSISADWIT